MRGEEELGVCAKIRTKNRVLKGLLRHYSLQEIGKIYRRLIARLLRNNGWGENLSLITSYETTSQPIN
jgi:hypothetical protein